jgi:hypothetical protein
MLINFGFNEGLCDFDMPFTEIEPMTVAAAEAMGWCPDEPIWRDTGFVVCDVSVSQSEEK